MRKKIKIPCSLFLFLGLAFLWHLRGKEFLEVSRQNLSIKFYNSVVRTYVPQMTLENPGGYPSVYHDATSVFFPMIAYAEDMIHYEGMEDETDYGELFAQENQQIGEMIKENEAALAAKPVGNTEESEAGTDITESESDGSADDSQSGETVTEPQPPEVVVTTTVGTNSQKLVSYSIEKMKDFDYLRQTFYQIDGSTTIGKDKLNVEKLLATDTMINESLEGVQILIYHTHSQEGYADSVPGDPSTSVVGVGEYLTQLLTQKYGFRVLHHTGEYDVESREHAYTNAAPALQNLLKENPNIQVVIDLHRDGVPNDTRLVTELNGTKTAQLMFFNGLSRTTSRGELTSLPNPYLDQNLAFSFQMQLAMCEYYPGLSRRIYLKGYRYNMHMCPKSLLVEVGAQTNTVEEAMNAMVPLADILAKVLRSH